jgi:hypothetical protein
VEQSLPRRQQDVAGPSERRPHRRSVDAPGFAGNLTLTTTGNKRSISIVSVSDTHNVSIAMIRS